LNELASDPILRRGDMAVTGIAAIFAGNSAEIINWLRGRQTKDLEYERINRNTAADLIERQQKEIEGLRNTFAEVVENARAAAAGECAAVLDEKAADLERLHEISPYGANDVAAKLLRKQARRLRALLDGGAK
jgi:hypothetical protein